MNNYFIKMNPYDLEYDLDSNNLTKHVAPDAPLGLREHVAPDENDSNEYYGGVKSSSTKTKTSSSRSKGLESITQPNNNYQEIVENIFKDYDLSDSIL